MTVVMAAQIEDSESYLAWLSTVHVDFQRSWASVLSSRCALRVMPLLGRKGRYHFENHFLAMKYGFWRNILSRSIRKFPDSAASVGSHFMGSAEVVPAIYPAYSAASNASDVMLALVNQSSIETAMFAAQNASAAVLGAGDPSLGSEELYWNIRLDAEFLEGGGKVAVLQNTPLWSNNPNWWKDEIFDWVIQFGDPSYIEANWAIWLQWYDSLAMGKAAFGLTGFEVANDLERRIALGDRDNKDKFNKDFWTREPGEINREIAEWVAEARAAQPQVDVELPQQSLDATMFGLNAEGKIARVAVPPEQRLLITPQQQLEYQALREDALELAARGQAGQ